MLFRKLCLLLLRISVLFLLCLVCVWTASAAQLQIVEMQLQPIDILSANQTEAAIFGNCIDTQKLGTMKITKLAAPGTQIPPELFFKIQVRLGENLLPVGTTYRIDNEQRMVEEAGVLFLRTGETAVIDEEILPGTEYMITELSASIDGYRPTYTGSAEQAAEVHCTMDGVSGTFPLAGTVHITVTNADYDFAAQIPINKMVLDFHKAETFFFDIEQVMQADDGWQVVKSLPVVDITVKANQTAVKMLTVGYDFGTEGIFFYRITERRGTGRSLHDDSIYLVEVTVLDGIAQITGIYRNNNETDRVLFINRSQKNSFYGEIVLHN